MRCLIVEDHLISRRILKEMLSSKFDCDVAVNGQEAIDSFLFAHESKSPYDIIFMDIMMPDVDGMEALNNIRNLERQMAIHPSKRVKVIMTTSMGDPHTVITSFSKCEADGFLIKPLNRKKLFSELKSLKIMV